MNTIAIRKPIPIKPTTTLKPTIPVTNNELPELPELGIEVSDSVLLVV